MPFALFSGPLLKAWSFRVTARDHKFEDFELTAKFAFFALIGRLAAQLLAAAFLFRYTDELISLLAKGKWKKEPVIQTSATMAASGRGAPLAVGEV